MSRIILLNKPFGVLCQFRDSEGRKTLKDFVSIPAVYPAGRLDADSEGLVVLTGDGALQNRISAPEHKLVKTSFVEVEGVATPAAIRLLCEGIDLRDFITQPAQATAVGEPTWLWPRQPPIRFRKNIPTSGIKISIAEGKNRQVRRMTAAVGFPTLRLMRYSIGDWNIEGLPPGNWKAIESVIHMSPKPPTPYLSKKSNLKR